MRMEKFINHAFNYTSGKLGWSESVNVNLRTTMRMEKFINHVFNYTTGKLGLSESVV